MVTRVTTSLMLLALACPAVFADGGFNGQDRGWQDHNHCKDRGCVAAPEIDPTQAVSALMLLGGAVAVLRGRRKDKKNQD
jgi:hypothetical protein